MMIHSRIKSLPPVFITVLALLLSGGAVTFVVASVGDPLKSVGVTPQQAVAAAVAFANDNGPSAAPVVDANHAAFADFAVSAPTDGLLDRFYTVQGQAIAATVDVHDGRVTTFLVLPQVPMKSGVSITSDNAMLAATRFLANRSVSVAGLDMSEELEDHGQTAEYVIQWQRTVNGVLVPDARQVSVNPLSGEVFSYADTSRPYTDPPAPVIDKATAEAKAISGSGLSNSAVVSSTSLRVTFDPSGGQHLTWMIDVYDLVPVSAGNPQAFQEHRIMSVDGTTGDVQVTGQS